MSVEAVRYRFEEETTVDGYTLKDVCRLLAALEEFARHGEVRGASELAGLVNAHLSADGLATVAASLARRLGECGGRPL